VFNTMLVLVVITSMLGPVLTEYFGRQRLAEQEAAARAAVVVPQTANQAVIEVSEPVSPGLNEASANQAEQDAAGGRPRD
jgi:hypothetical protein